MRTPKPSVQTINRRRAAYLRAQQLLKTRTREQLQELGEQIYPARDRIEYYKS